ncbi:MAG: hypothetical protein LUG86_08965 [Oscillospiraceae bacterium]|nr:hypothetical protein [Oscillospiraceae bacterium]
MTIDFEGLDESLEINEDRIEDPEILETTEDGVTVWMLSEAEEIEEDTRAYSRAFENLDALEEPTNLDVMSAAMEFLTGRTFDGSMSFYDSFRQMEEACTVLNRPIEQGRAAGCISNGGCAMILGDNATLEQLTDTIETPVAVGGIGLLPISAAGKDSVQLMWKVPIIAGDLELKEMGCRLVEVYK